MDAHEMLRSLCSENELCRVIAERTREGLLIADADEENLGRVVAVNEAFAQMHGYTVGELLTMNVSQIDAPEYAETLQERIDQIMISGHDSREIEHVRKDGSRFPLEYHAHVIEAGGRKQIMSFIHDITERKRLQEQLHTCEERLEALI